MTKKAKEKTYKYSLLFYKELFLATLAVLSVYFVFYEYFGQVNKYSLAAMHKFELSVAIIFLTDFFYYFAKAKDKKQYMRSNWYMLVASIPILDSWAELLRGLRILELVRLVRAGEHLKYALKATKR